MMARHVRSCGLDFAARASAAITAGGERYRVLAGGPSHHIAPDATAHAPATHSTADTPTAAEAASLFHGALILTKRLESVQLTGRGSSLSGGAVGDKYC